MAQLFAARHPERVEKLVLMNTTAGAQSAFDTLPGHYADDGDPPNEPRPLSLEQFQRARTDVGRRPCLHGRLDDAEPVRQRLPLCAGSDDSSVRRRARRTSNGRSKVSWSASTQSNISPRSMCRPWWSTRRVIGCLTSPTGASWPTGSPTPAYLGVPGRRTISSGSHPAMARTSSEATIGFVVGGTDGPSNAQSVVSLPCFSPTSSTRRRARHRSGDVAWLETLESHDRICREVVETCTPAGS